MRRDVSLWMDEMFKKHGWYAHYDFNDQHYPYSVNIHTHGFYTKYGHLDLQICYPMDEKLAYAILSDIANQVSSGKKFMPGIKYPDILKKFDVEFAEAKEDGRVVLRMIFPDKYGNVRGELKDQWKGCRIYCCNN